MASGAVKEQVKFVVDPQEKAEAERIAASLGFSLPTAMRSMMRRFVAEGGFPYPMRKEELTTQAPAPHLGVSISRLAEIARKSGEEARESHLKAGRAVAFSTLDGTLYREHSNGEVEPISRER